MTPFLLLALATQEPVTIERALALARSARPTVSAAAAGIQEAEAQWRVAGAVPNPSVGYSYTDDTPRRHLTIQQSFDWLVRRGAERRAATAGIERARADSVRTMAELDAEVRRAFYGAIAASELLRLVLADAAVAESLVVLSARRLAVGDIAAMENDRIRFEAARVRQNVSRARESVERSQLVLRRVLAMPSGSPRLELQGDLRAGLLDPPAGRRHDDPPVVTAARADSIGAVFRIKGIRRSRVPVPAIEFGADWSEPSLPGQTLWLFGLSLPLPLWNQSGGELAAATARSLQANAALNETRLETDQQIAEAELRLRQARARALAATDSLLPAGQRLRVQALRAYQLGETGILPVLDALRAEREIESMTLEDLLAFQEARALWYALVGSTESR